MPISFWNPATRLATLLIAGVLATLAAIDVALELPFYDHRFQAGETVAGADGAAVTLEELDLLQEPGELNEREVLWDFYGRQARLAQLARAGDLRVTSGDETRALTGRPAGLGDLAPLFWVHVFVAFAGLVISGWLWSLKSRDLAARLFAGSGIGLFISAIPAGVYTTRELALPAPAFRVLEELNAIGASLFGISMIGLFLVFPLRLRGWRPLLVAQAAALGLWTALFVFKLTPAWANITLVILVEMLLICAAIAAQFVATRRDPVARASLTWLGVSVLIGAGGFVGLNSVPLLLKQTPLNQGYAFLFFILIYLGLAAGLSRYRLFDVGQWAFRLLYYAVGAALLIAMDAALIFALNMERAPALGVSLLLIAVLYLPLRDLVWRRLSRRPPVANDELLADAMHVALAASGQERAQRWVEVLRKLFDPLELAPAPSRVEDARVTDEGVTLLIPAVAGSGDLKLSYPSAGRALFNRASLNLARQLVKLVQQAESSRRAYDRGVLEERRRVAQDLHDDVGARLLTGLALSDERTRPTLEGALADIRAIVGGMSGETTTWERLLADLRHECAQRLESARLELEWPAATAGLQPGREVDETLRKTLSSAFRECVSNVVRHAQARRVRVELRAEGGELRIRIEDDGRGFAPPAAGEREGFGLKSLERRVRGVSGQLRIEALRPGTRVEIRLPLPPERGDLNSR